MDLRGSRRSSNVEDRRGRSPLRTGAGLSLGGIAFLVVLSFLGINPLPYLGMATREAPQVQQAPSEPYQESAAEAEMSDRVTRVLAETEDTWSRFFQGQYPAPGLVLYTEATPTGCGTGQAAMGPFYCPEDRKVYIDLTFFEELSQRFGAPGDFAQAYVLAHEVGHHIQNLQGLTTRVQEARQQVSPEQANNLSVRLELQADCYAGLWAHDAAQRIKLDQGDVEEGLAAATAIGDDRLQRQSRGTVVPESFTHGSSEQRSRWLNVGLQSGDPKACDTFSARQL